jgi:hypothetical protein
MNANFFHDFAFQIGSTTTVLKYALTCLRPLITIYRRLYRSDQSWPFDLIMKRESIRTVNEQLRKFRPRSDLLVSKSTLPRLLVEVNSKPKKERPEDLVRMLLRVPPSFASQIDSWTRSWWLRTLFFLPYIFGTVTR